MTALERPRPGGFLLVLAILLPAAGIILSFALGGRNAERVALRSTPFGFALACAIAAHVASGRQADRLCRSADLPPPLGIALRADGISAVMLVAAAMIVTAAAFYARAKFATPEGVRESRSALTFWIMLQAIWAALTIIFVGGDLFNLYVALELLTFAAVPLVCIDGRPGNARRRLALFAVRLVRLDFLSARRRLVLRRLCEHWTFPCWRKRVQSTPVVWMAAALITAGLLAKTALVPVASVAAAGSRQCAGRRQRGAFRPCRERLVLPDPAAVVLCAAGASARRRRQSARRARLGGDHRRQRAGACVRRG